MRPTAWLGSILKGCAALGLGLLLSCSGGGGDNKPIPTPAPSISGFSPTQAVQGGTVTISGSNLSNATVKFNEVAAPVISNTSSQVVTTVPTGATSGFISVTTAGGTATSVANFTVLPSAPSIAGFSPTSGLVGSTVTITGTSLTGATAVSFHGTNATTFTVLSSTQLTASVPAGATSGAIAITTPGGTATSTGSFTVLAPVPTITGFSPASGPIGTSVVITGTNLTSASSVTFNSASAAYTVDSSTQITAVVPSATTGLISVTTPGGTATSATAFTVTTPVPTLTGFSPASGPIGTSVVITGTNFAAASLVAFHGVSATFTVNGPTQITATVPSTTTGTIAVTTPGGTATSASAFTVTTLLPTITGFSPTSGPVGSSVVITGTNLTAASAVTFNGASALYTVNSATQITATVPSTTTGTIAVTTPGGVATSATSFTVTPSGGSPTITSLSVASALPGQAVVITGTNLGSATAVRFNGLSARFIEDSTTQLTALVPSGATSGSVTVQTSTGTATSPSAFTVSAYPTSQQSNSTLTPIPDAATSADGTPVFIPFTVSGLSFPIKDVQVSIHITHTFVGDLDLQLIAPDGTAIALVGSSGDAGHDYGTGCAPGQYTVFSDSAPGPLAGGSPYVGTYKPAQALSALVGKTANGTWMLRIQDLGHLDTGNFVCGSLLVTAGPQPPTITGFNPSMGPNGTTVLLTGTRLAGASALTIGNVSAAAPQNVTDTSLTFVVPSGAPIAPVRVVAAAGLAISGNVFTPLASGPTADLFIDGAYVTQSAQDYSGAVPLVAGKDGVLRVFARGNQAGITAPSVRVRTYSGATLTGTQTIAPSLGTAPTTVSEGFLSQSWNYSLPGAAIQPGLGLLIDVDPANAIAEADETNNTWPPSGTPMAMDVRTLQTFHGTLIPVTQSSLTGNATSGNLASWYAKFQKMYPIAPGMDVVLGAPYTTSQVLVSGGGGWSALLSELEAKRVVEASSRYYYGALNVSYGSGVAGLGYVPAPGSSAPRSAMGWDKTTGYADGGLYFDVLTHETGHNMGRAHSPCGGAAGPDPAYPYPGALIGIYGLDVSTMLIKDPAVYTDIMAYCTPVWISDYVYHSILDFRQASPFGIAPPPAAAAVQTLAADSSVQDCLLISGRILNGNVELDPALQVRTVPTVLGAKALHGSRLIEGRDASGKLLFQRSLPLLQVADDIPGAQIQHFIAAIPMKAIQAKELNELRVLGDSGPEAVQWSNNALPLKSGSVQLPQARTFGEGEVRLTWDVVAHPLVMVRDASTGEVLSFARGGDMVIKTKAKQLELTLSSGVTSEKMVLNTTE